MVRTEIEPKNGVTDTSLRTTFLDIKFTPAVVGTYFSILIEQMLRGDEEKWRGRTILCYFEECMQSEIQCLGTGCKD